MTIEVVVAAFWLVLFGTLIIIFKLIKKEEHIMAKVNELAGILSNLSDKVVKIAAEVQALKDALVNTEIPVDAQTALDNLSAQ